MHKKLPDEKDTRFLFDSLDKVVGPFRNRATDYAFGSFHCLRMGLAFGFPWACGDFSRRTTNPSEKLQRIY